jgi:hypothetical protein
LTLSPSGQFITPSSCPASLLVRFLDENMDESVRLLLAFERDSAMELQLERECRTRLEMKSLEKDNHVAPGQMISFCTRLLDPGLRRLMSCWKDCSVNVSTYYSVSDDGTIYVPWNFK